MPVPSGLVRNSTSPGARAGVRQDARRVDRAGHRVAELDFGVLHGVAAEQRDAGLAQLVEAAAENVADRVALEALFRETRRSRARSADGRPSRRCR